LLRKLTLTVVLSIALIGLTGQTAQASSSNSNYQSALRAVCHYFGPYCSQAMQIVNCETGGTYDPWASNGQYLGIFQMGSEVRAIYGHGNNVWAQAKAAYALFRARGFQPWLCCEPRGCGA
jgi:hypothetical protein